MSGVFPLVPLEGDGPTFGEHSFDSIKLFPDTPGLAWLTNHHVYAMAAAALTIIFWLVVSHKPRVVPSKRQFAGEYLYDMIRNGVVRDIFGHDFGRYKTIMVPWLIALFTFILINNLFGEFFLTMFPTMSKIGFPYALAGLSFLLYNVLGIARQGPKYFLHMLVPPGVPWWLLWLIVPLELISNFIVRPITLALRLFANMFAGHLVVLVFAVGGSWLLTQTPVLWKIAGGVSVVFVFALFALELLVAFLQAYVFTVLTAQYVASAVAGEH